MSTKQELQLDNLLMKCLFGSAVKIRKSAAYDLGIRIGEFCVHPATGKVFFMIFYWKRADDHGILKWNSKVQIRGI